MKSRLFAIPSLTTLLATAPAATQTYIDPATLPPASWLETVELQPGRNFDSLVFETFPGVDYTVSTSEDLFTWTPLGQHYYGLGQQVVIPIVERFTPTSSPTPPPEGPPEPAPVFASLLMNRIPGGLSISFLSADSGAPVIYPLPGLTIPSEWDNVPLYASPALGGYSFTIWFSASLPAAPVVTPALSTADQAMVAAFTTRFPDFAAEVQANVQRTRSLPPVPFIQGAHRFYRVAANSYLDSDGDGTPDWLEFATSASPTPGQPAADPFNGDADANGVSDGAQKDSDGDGIPDDQDTSKSDSLYAWSKNEPMLFACFSLGGGYPPYQVNDQGTVLYQHSIWKNGQFLPLNAEAGTSLTSCIPYGLGDNGLILGFGVLDLPGDSVAAGSQCQVAWPADGGNPVAMKNGASYLVPVGAGPNQPVTMGTISDMVVNPDGKFLAYAVEPKSDEDPDRPANILKIENETSLQVWKGEPGGAVTAQSGNPGVNAWIADNGTFCGKDSQGQFTSGTKVFKDFYKKAAQLPDGKLAVFTYPFISKPPEMQILSGDFWSDSQKFTDVLDSSFYGKFLIAHRWEIWESTDYGSTQANERMPGLTGWDNVSACELIDTTRHGWTLALRKNGDTATSYDAMLALPLWPSTNPIARGLDNQSAMASRSDVFTPIERQGNKPEFWVMVPAGGSTSIRMQSAATSEAPVTLSSSGGLTVQPDKLASRDTNLVIGAPASEEGQEYPIDLKIGSTGSSSIPIKVKVMKARVVNVQIHPISRGTSPGGVLPSKVEIETYLNDIFKPQINAQFNVIIHDWQPLPPNVESGGNFYAIDPPGPGQTTVASTYAGGGKIEVFLMGGFETLASSGGKAPGGLNGLANPSQNWVWLGTNHLTSGTAAGRDQWLNTLAHEIGHVMTGMGHPDDSSGPAVLPQTDRKARLMCSGTFRHSGDPVRKLLVKAEWDVAENWLTDNIDNPRQ